MKRFLFFFPLFFLIGCPSSQDPLSSLSQKLVSARHGELVAIKINYGGSTLAFQTNFSDGTQALFKPEQKMTRQGPPRYEIAAYVISELLGLKRVPPAFFQSFSAKDFIGLAQKDPKLKTLLEKRQKELEPVNGQLQGALLAFVPKLIYPKLEGFSLDSKEGIKKWMTLLKAKQVISNEQRALLQQVSDMLVFDFILGNQDRWSGGNLLAQEINGKINLVLIDHSMSFGTTKEGHGIAKKYFLEVQTFSKPLINRLKNLTQEQIDTALSKYRGEYKFLVDKARREAILSRSLFVVRHVEQMQEKRFF